MTAGVGTSNAGGESVSETPRPRYRVVRLGAASFRFGGRGLAVAAALIVITALLFVVRICTTKLSITPVDAFRILTAGGERWENIVMFDSQLPIALVAILVGFALGLAGSLTQVIARNPLATPDLLGITSGASAAAAAVISFGSSLPAWISGLGVPAAAMIGGLLTAVVMYIFSWRRGLDPVRLVLIGVALTAGLQAVIAYILTRASVGDVRRAQVWIVGSVSSVGWHAVWPPLVASVFAVVVVAAQSRNLRILGLGPGMGHALGVRVGAASGIILLLAVVVTAVAVSSAGPIAFVALLAPQIAMRLVRVDMPGPYTSGLVGAVLVIGGDEICNTVLPAGLPVGVVTAGIGGIALIYLMIRMTLRSSA